MFTVSLSKSPTNASRYFAGHLCQDEYYSEHAAVRGQWHGRLVPELGLSTESAVDAESFRRLCQGKQPTTNERLTVRMNANRRALFDFTISAPKSVSIMALLAGDARVIDAHREAVGIALAQVESAASSRVRKGDACDSRAYRPTGNIVAASFLHRESRSLDPQLHTHCIVFNVTFDPVECRFKALESRAMFDSLSRSTHTYRTRLAANLRQLGYRVGFDGNGCPNIEGVPAVLMARFSKRATSTRTAIAGLELQTGKPLSQKAVAAIFRTNRERKQALPPEAIHEFQASQLSTDERSILAALKAAAETKQTKQAARAIEPRPTLSVSGAGWLAVVRGALTLAHGLKMDAHAFTLESDVCARVRIAIPYLRYTRTARHLRTIGRIAAKLLSR